MIADIRTILWKEWKDVLTQGGRRAKWYPLVFLAIFGLFMPLQTGSAWVETPVSLGFYVMIPIILVVTWVADSFAGERERGTLDTLLATRLSDRAILFGKIAAVAGFAWGMTLAAFFTGLVVVNIAHWTEQIVLYKPSIALGCVGLSFLTATLSANAGILVSLRAATVRQAQQTLGLAVFAVAWIPILVINLIPATWKAYLTELLKSGDITLMVSIVVASLVVLDLALLGVAIARFQRTRLILD